MKQVSRRIKIVKWQEVQTSRGLRTRLVEEKASASQSRGSPLRPSASASQEPSPMDVDMEYNYNAKLVGESKVGLVHLDFR
jgi:hypothetical protein